VKVAELEGALLDYWVALAGKWPRPRIDDGLCWIDVPACDGDPGGALDAAFSPSADWEVAGPIIEREHIMVDPPGGAHGTQNEWAASVLKSSGPLQWGSTALEAAMRAFVAARFGEEVEDAPQNHQSSSV
jgi:hypothetical protein